MNIVERIKRLPNWAISHINDLERTIEILKSQLSNIENNTKTRISYNDLVASGSEKRYIPQTAIISFCIDDGSGDRERSVEMQVIFKNNDLNTHKVLDIYCNSAGIVVKPVASNHIVVDVSQ